MKQKTLLIAAIAFILGLLGVSAYSGEIEGYWTDKDGKVVKNSNGLCWRTGYWKPEMAIAECDPDLVKKVEAPAPKPEPIAAPAPAPVVAPAPEPQPEPKVAIVPKPLPQRVSLEVDALFDFNKAVLKEQGKGKLDELAN